MIQVGQEFRDKYPRTPRTVRVLEVGMRKVLIENTVTKRRTLVKPSYLTSRFTPVKGAS